MGNTENRDITKCPTCGELLDSVLWASDAENDYYAPVCWRCESTQHGNQPIRRQEEREEPETEADTP